MKTMRLNIENEWNDVQRNIRNIELQRNAIIDAKRENKKDKKKVAALKIKEAQMDKELALLRGEAREMDTQFDNLSRRMGFIRLKNYVLAEAMYDNLIAYQEFIKNECVTDDKEITDTIQQTIDLVKKLPFECGDSDNDRFREVYNAIADAFIEKLKTILIGIFDQVMIELDKDEDAKIRK
jgi:hypothetical protein